MSVPEIAPAAARARLAELAVVDVRGRHEFEGPLGRIAGARLVPLPELEARAGELPQGRPLLLVCRSGARSGRACERLAALGIGPVLNLTGGMIAWNAAGFDVEETQPADAGALLAIVVAWLAQLGGTDAEAARSSLRDGLAGEGVALEPPTQESVGRAIDRAEALLRARAEPPDLGLSTRAFRRWLAGL